MAEFENRELENLFQDAFSEYSVEASEDVWGGLERRLALRPDAVVAPATTSTKMWYKAMAVAAAFLLGIFSTLLIIKSDLSKTPTNISENYPQENIVDKNNDLTEPKIENEANFTTNTASNNKKQSKIDVSDSNKSVSTNTKTNYKPETNNLNSTNLVGGGSNNNIYKNSKTTTKGNNPIFSKGNELVNNVGEWISNSNTTSKENKPLFNTKVRERLENFGLLSAKKSELLANNENISLGENVVPLPKSKCERSNYFSIKPFVGVYQSFRNITDNPSSTGTGLENALYFNERENKSIAYNYGLNVQYRIKPKWSIETGVSLLNYSQKGNYINKGLLTGNNVDAFILTSLNTNRVRFDATDILAANPTIAEGDLVDVDMEVQQKVRFLNIPLGVNYHIGNNKLGWNIGIGLSANKYIDNELQLISSQLPINTIKNTYNEDLKKWSFGYYSKLGVDYKINSTISVFCDGMWQAGLSNLNNEGNRVNVKSEMWGGNIGVQYNF